MPGFLPALVQALQQAQPYVSPAPKRSAVAIVCRVVGLPVLDYKHDVNDPKSFLKSTAARQSTATNTEILFIKRATNPADAWSGNVAFPGGRRDALDIDDCATAVRESFEEIGLDLSVSGGLALCAGRLSDRGVSVRGAYQQGFVLCPFVFVLTVPEPPAFVLQPSEVAATRWVSVDHLNIDKLDLTGVQRQAGNLPLIGNWPVWIKRFIGVDTLFFPSLELPPPIPVSHRLPHDNTRHSSNTESELHSVWPKQNETTTPLRFQLWGLTLAATSNLLELAGAVGCTTKSTLCIHNTEHTYAGRPRMNWPPLYFRGNFANAIVAAACGAWDIADFFRGRRVLKTIRGIHVLALLSFPASACGIFLVLRKFL